MPRWDLVYKWADPESRTLVDAVTSALENCDRKLTDALAAKPEAGGGLDERAFLLDCAGHLAKYGCNVYHKNGPCRWQWNWQREAASPRSDAGSEG